jgi:integrase
MTFGVYLRDRWAPAMRPTVRKTTAAAYEQMAKHLDRHLGKVPLGELTGPQLTAVYGELLEGGLSARTVRYVHVTAHRALKDAVRWHLVSRNVADDADSPRQPGAEPKAWTPDQVATFLALAEGDRWAPLWRLAATTGLRRGELAGLRWKDLELGAGMLSVNRTTVVANGHAVESEPKTARGRRRIALDAQTVDALKCWRRQQSTEHLAMGAGWQGDGRVFVCGRRLGASPQRHHAFVRTARREGGAPPLDPPRTTAQLGDLGAPRRRADQGRLGSARALV